MYSRDELLQRSREDYFGVYLPNMSNALDIDFTHGDNHGPSCKKSCYDRRRVKGNTVQSTDP